MLYYLLLAVFLLSVPCRADNGDDDLFNYSKKQDEALVVNVPAPDLLVLEDGRHIKLIGVQALPPLPPKPVQYDEKGHVIPQPEEPTIPLQEQALTYAQDLLQDKKVKLEYDVDSGDTASGYTWAYVYLPDGRMANAELLRMGFVKLNIVVPNVKYEDKLRMAYQEAKRQKRGLEGE